MAEDIQALRLFIHETREKAAFITDGAHVGADVKEVIKNLLTIVANFEELADHSTGQSADARLMKKKLEQSKAEMRNIEIKIDNIRKAISGMVEEVKVINAEIAQIVKAHATENPQHPNLASAARMKAAVQKLAECIVAVSSNKF